MAYRCQVLTSWSYDAERRTNEQQVALDYPATWSDVTGQPDEHIIPDPNLFVSQGDELTAEQMTALLADSNYVVLWFEEVA